MATAPRHVPPPEVEVEDEGSTLSRWAEKSRLELLEAEARQAQGHARSLEGMVQSLAAQLEREALERQAAEDARDELLQVARLLLLCEGMLDEELRVGLAALVKKHGGAT